MEPSISSLELTPIKTDEGEMFMKRCDDEKIEDIDIIKLYSKRDTVLTPLHFEAHMRRWEDNDIFLHPYTRKDDDHK